MRIIRAIEEKTQPLQKNFLEESGFIQIRMVLDKRNLKSQMTEDDFQIAS